MANKKANKQNHVKTTISAADPNNAKASSFDYCKIALGLIVLLVAFIRYKLLAVPFERDEGEYAYIGNLFLQGGIPYLDAYNMKLPGTYGMYSIIIALFGSSPTSIHFGLMVVNIVTIILLYLTLKRLFNPMIALVSATVYSLLSISLAFYGFAAHATHFINLFAMLGLYFYSIFYENKKWHYAGLIGLMFGLALLMKQQAALLIVMAGVMIIATEILTKHINWKKLFKNIFAYSIGAIIPYIIVLLIMIKTGAFAKFWFWTVEYARSYTLINMKPEKIKLNFHSVFDGMFAEYPIIWLLAFAGIVLVWLGKQTLFQKVFILSLYLFCFAAVCPGFFFRQHYFILALPAVGLLYAISIEYLIEFISKGKNNTFFKVLPFASVLLMGLIAMGKDKKYYFSTNVDEVNKRAYGYNPFLEAAEIGKFIANNCNEDDKVAILGSEPEILVYANRKSATGYLYVYPLVEPQKYNLIMQNEMISEIEKAKPKIIVFCSVMPSWLTMKGTPTVIFDWINKYLPENYDLVGMVDIPKTAERSQFYWGSEATFKHKNENYIYVLKRKATKLSSSN
jgi:hypothetical protein